MDTFARTLRQHATDAEHRLWWHLRDRNLGGYKFRRQQGIGRYVADFVCLEKKVVVEVDGGQHAWEWAYDEARTEFLTREGFKVLRFWNNQVLAETEAVLQEILDVLTAASPHPGPLPQGEREKQGPGGRRRPRPGEVSPSPLRGEGRGEG